MDIKVINDYNWNTVNLVVARDMKEMEYERDTVLLLYERFT